MYFLMQTGNANMMGVSWGGDIRGGKKKNEETLLGDLTVFLRY